jgi:hypothetical protein
MLLHEASNSARLFVQIMMISNASIRLIESFIRFGRSPDLFKFFFVIQDQLFDLLDITLVGRLFGRATYVPSRLVSMLFAIH